RPPRPGRPPPVPLRQSSPVRPNGASRVDVISEEAYVPARLGSAGFLVCGVLVNARAPPIGKPAFSLCVVRVGTSLLDCDAAGRFRRGGAPGKCRFRPPA